MIPSIYLLDSRSMKEPVDIFGYIDPDDPLDESEIEDELLCEKYFKGLKRVKGVKIDRSKLLEIHNKHNIRRDLVEVLNLKVDEQKFRKFVADELRLMRDEAKNGYKDLSHMDQEKILDCRINLLSYLFGNYDIFFSRRKNLNEKRIPLRKDLTCRVIRCYKPYGLDSKEDRDEDDSEVYLS